jgi:hypothetical protein
MQTPIRSGRAADQRRQLAEGPSDRVAAARRVLQRDLDAVAGGPRKRLVEGADDPANPGLEPRAHVRAGMDDHERETERLATLELVGERVDRLCPRGGVGAGQIDEVARVREDPPDARLPSRGGERTDRLVVERPRRPLTLILQEDLDGAAAHLVPALECQVQAAGDRHVGSDLVRPRRHGGQGTTLLSCLL